MSDAANKQEQQDNDTSSETKENKDLGSNESQSTPPGSSEGTTPSEQSSQSSAQDTGKPTTETSSESDGQVGGVDSDAGQDHPSKVTKEMVGVSDARLMQRADSGQSGALQTTIRAATVAAPAVIPVVSPPAAQTKAATVSPALDQFQALIAKAKSSGLVSLYFNNLASYIEEMRPKKVNPLPAALRQQQSLYSTILGICNRLEDDFYPVWTALLAVFQEHRDGVFHERYVNRHMDNINLGTSEIAAFQNLLNLIRLTADPRSRALGLKQVDFTRTLQHALTDAARARLGNFYEV